ncbi:MAG: hypothetical protein U1E25_03310 [Methylocystis sp.]
MRSSLKGGAFVSLLDPPDDLGAAAAQYKNVGALPCVGVSDKDNNAMLASPVITL